MTFDVSKLRQGDGFVTDLHGGLPYAMFERLFYERHVTGGLTETQFYLVRAMLMNDDKASAKRMLQDWGKLRRPTCEIAKFVPGTHHYVLGKKFDTLQEAQDHALRAGYDVTRVFEVDGSGKNAANLREVLRKREDVGGGQP